MQQYGDVLHVAYAPEGSVRRAEDRVRISAQLIDVASGYHLFSQS
jgi:TolB-like protein